MNRYAIKRFALKASLLSFFAVSQSPHVWRGVMVLFSMAGLFDAGIALWRKQSLKAPTITYWDEAAVMMLVVLVVRIACSLAYSDPR